MAISIMRANPKEATFDKFLRRIGGVADIANSGIGAYSNVKGIQEKNRLAEAAKIKAEDDAQGIYGQKELDALMIDEAKEGDAGARKFKVKGPDGVKEVFRRKIEKLKEVNPLDDEMTRADIDYKKAQAFALRNKPSEAEIKANETKQEKLMGLETPFGLANTIDDAKQLKAAHELKSGFDSKLQQMIALREKHNGGSILNREDVGRGKQLSKDLLLAYKDMAKLGVLSQADEKILNAIIPDDPLAYTSPLAAIQGQDPILHKMKSFSEDSKKDFETRVSTRTRGGLKNLVSGGQQKQDPEFVTISNGKETIQVRKDKLADAEAEGFKQVGGSPTVMARP